MKRIAPFIFMILLAAMPAAAEGESSAAFDSALREVLDTVGFSRGEIRIPTERIGRAQEMVKRALSDPFAASADLRSAAGVLAGAAAPREALSLMRERFFDSSARIIEPSPKIDLVEELRLAVERITLLPAYAGIGDAMSSSEEEMTLMEEHFAAAAEREETKRLGGIAFSVDLAALTTDALRIAEALELDSSARGECIVPPGVTGAILSTISTPDGWIVYGDSGANSYSGKFLAVIDVGGGDLYLDPASAESSVSVVMDLGGDDVYRGRICAAARGLAMLVDKQGNDRYEGSSQTIAFADQGIALLWDGDGDDRYSAARFGEAFAAAGVAVLFDRSGNDAYSVGSYGQAVSGPNGTAVLCDAAGDDVYSVSGGGSDIIRDPSQRLSFSQGFSTGLRPGSAGGTALLVDGSGNDLYSAALFCQGVGYWGSLGALVDLGGADIYRAHRYSQGGGVHLSAGFLLDAGGGRDFYQAYSVSQGCGHDLSIALLDDDGGNDLYRADNLSQAAGSSNGFGFLFDRGGNDHYVLEGKAQGQGCGAYEAYTRRYGSLGVLVDLSGADWYSMAGRDSSCWVQGELGVGVDQ